MPGSISQSFCFVLFGVMCFSASAQQTGFTYQGSLSLSNQPASGLFDFSFSLWDAYVGGGMVGVPVTNNAVLVTNGSVTTCVDFGNGFDGGSRWLELAVRAETSEPFQVLSPRQAVTATPYSLYARAVPATGIRGSIESASFGASSINSNVLAPGAAIKDVGPATNALWLSFTNYVMLATNDLSSALTMKGGIPVLNVRKPPFSQAGGDTAAIQMALDYCTNSANPPVVYLPAGDYWITNTLEFKAEGTSLEGDGYYPPHASNIRLDHAGFRGTVGINAAPFRGTTLHLRSVRNLCVKGKGIDSGTVGISFGAASGEYAGYGGAVENVSVNSCGIGLAISNYLTVRIIKSDIVGCDSCVVLCGADSTTMEDCRTGFPVGNAVSGTGILITESPVGSYGLGITIKGGEHGPVSRGWIRAPRGALLTIEGGNYESWSMDSGFYFSGDGTRLLVKNIRAFATNAVSGFRLDDNAGLGTVILGGEISTSDYGGTAITFNGPKPVYFGREIVASNISMGHTFKMGSPLIETNNWQALQMFRALGISQTNPPPSAPDAPEAWVDITVQNKTYKLPLYR